MKHQDQVARLVAGPGNVFICDECVRLCVDILWDGIDLPDEVGP